MPWPRLLPFRRGGLRFGSYQLACRGVGRRRNVRRQFLIGVDRVLRALSRHQLADRGKSRLRGRPIAAELIPVFNFIVLLIFAFGKWPLEEQLAAARGYGAGPGSSPGSGGYGTGGTVAPTPYRP